ncbi:hypothetical protein C8R47DRAFT_1327776 [Mycena vitilis]|nr:hypothetical protein C8R47DRAFT_1327776 [Mycena vitilis]
MKGRPPLLFPSLTRTTTTTKMPNSTITLVFCFFAFVCGQLFSAYLHPSPVKLEHMPCVVAVDHGFSLTALVSIVFVVLIVHDAVLILLLHGLAKADVKTKSAYLVSKSLKAAVDNAPGFHRPTLLLLPPAPATGPRPPPPSIFVSQGSLRVLPLPMFERRWLFGVPRPFWTRAIYQQRVGLRATSPLLEHSLALALAPKLSTPIPSLACRPQHGVPLFARLAGHLAGDVLSIKHELDEGPDIQSIDASSTAEEENVEGEERESHDTDLSDPYASACDEPPLDDSPTQARPSRAPFLRFVAASALLRRLQFRVVEEVPYASIEEVKDEDDDCGKVEEDVEHIEEDVGDDVGEDVKIVEESVKAAAEPVKSVKDPFEEEDVKENVKDAKEDVDKNTKEPVEDTEEKTKVPESVHEDNEKTVAVAEDAAEVENATQIADVGGHDNEAAGKVPVQAAPEVEEGMETLPVDAPDEKDAEDTAADEERAGPACNEYDDLPNYEDFVRDVPLEPLFEEWAPAAPAYAITRPPPLAALAACTTTATTTTTRDARTRGSHIGLLSRIRLSSRVSAGATASS